MAAFRQPDSKAIGRLWVAGGCTRPGFDEQQYGAHRKFEAKRPERAVQQSAASVHWAVLAGQRMLAHGRFAASHSGRQGRTMQSRLLSLDETSDGSLNP